MARRRLVFCIVRVRRAIVFDRCLVPICRGWRRCVCVLVPGRIFRHSIEAFRSQVPVRWRSAAHRAIGIVFKLNKPIAQHFSNEAGIGAFLKIQKAFIRGCGANWALFPRSCRPWKCGKVIFETCFPQEKTRKNKAKKITGCPGRSNFILLRKTFRKTMILLLLSKIVRRRACCA